ncbi:hypothetical protein ACHAWF_015080 [Thalassiosira exigua]
MDEEAGSSSGGSPLDLEVCLPGLAKSEIEPDNLQSTPPMTKNLEQLLIPKEEWPKIRVKDARSIQNDDADISAFFNARGFYLLPHRTGVTVWNESYIKPFGSDISNIYIKEVESIIRNKLLPDYHVVEVDGPPAVLRRGPGSKNNFYGSGVHQDYGLTFEDYKNGVSAFDPTGFGFLANDIQKKYDRKEVCGMMVINFWRPVEGYTKENPLLTKPLAVCDPVSVATNDTLHIGLNAKAYGGVKGKHTDQLALKYNGNHDWYYYPRMIDDEVLAFKQLEVWKSDIAKREYLPVRGCFHTAFDDPNAPEGSAPRKSTEYRVNVYLGKKKERRDEAEWAPPTPQPLWPKSGSEWGNFALDLGSIGMLIAAATGKCPAIPGAFAFVICFSITNLVGGILKFCFSLQRPGNDKRYVCANIVLQLTGILQLAFGIWGMALIFPNVKYFADPSPETCDLGPLIAMIIPSSIIALVIVVLVGMALYSVISKKKKKQDD